MFICHVERGGLFSLESNNRRSGNGEEVEHEEVQFKQKDKIVYCQHDRSLEQPSREIVKSASLDLIPVQMPTRTVLKHGGWTQ